MPAKKKKWSKIIGPGGWWGILVDWLGGIGVGLLVADYQIVGDVRSLGWVLIGVSLLGHVLILKRIFR